MISDEYLYAERPEVFELPPEYPTLVLRRELKLETPDGRTVTVKKGEIIVPYATDLETYVDVLLKDGTIGRAKVTFGDPEDHFPIFINGSEQDEYAEIPYAD